MVEIFPNLFIGSQDDYERRVRGKTGWKVVHACKEPYHRNALGYTGRAAPKTHPEYLIARRPNRLILNLIDPDDPKYIPRQIIDSALVYIHKALGDNRQVLVHCNQGESRGPSIGLLYLVKYTNLLPKESSNAAVSEFRKLYPKYNPSHGMREFINTNWRAYAQ